MLKEKKKRSNKHLRFVASLPCMLCGAREVQAAHIRTGNNAGVGMKSGDDCVVPLCIRCHAEQHSMSEKKFWGKNLDKAQALAKKLYRLTGKEEAAVLAVIRWEK
jgi:hypothetical protein